MTRSHDAVLAYIAAHADADGVVTDVTVDEIAGTLAMSTTLVRRRIAGMIHDGLLTRQQAGNANPVYHVLTPVAAYVQPDNVATWMVPDRTSLGNTSALSRVPVSLARVRWLET